MLPPLGSTRLADHWLGYPLPARLRAVLLAQQAPMPGGCQEIDRLLRERRALGKWRSRNGNGCIYRATNLKSNGTVDTLVQLLIPWEEIL